METLSYRSKRQWRCCELTQWGGVRPKETQRHAPVTRQCLDFSYLGIWIGWLRRGPIPQPTPLLLEPSQISLGLHCPTGGRQPHRLFNLKFTSLK